MNADSSLTQVFAASEPIGRESLPELTAGRITAMIRDGRLAPGSRLPNELELAEAMRVSRGTLRAALHLLQQQGRIWRRQGVGTFVSQKPIFENRLDLNSGVTAMIESMGLVPGCRDMEIKHIAANEFSAEQLRVPRDSILVYIRRTRTADRKLVVASVDLFPAELLQSSSRPLDIDALKQVLEEKTSIYRLLEDEFHISIDHGIAKLRPVKADAELVKKLGLENDVPVGSMMLYLEQVDSDRNQQPVLLSYEYHVPSISTFTVYRR